MKAISKDGHIVTEQPRPTPAALLPRRGSLSSSIVRGQPCSWHIHRYSQLGKTGAVADDSLCAEAQAPSPSPKGHQRNSSLTTDTSPGSISRLRHSCGTRSNRSSGLLQACIAWAISLSPGTSRRSVMRRFHESYSLDELVGGPATARQRSMVSDAATVTTENGC